MQRDGKPVPYEENRYRVLRQIPNLLRCGVGGTGISGNIKKTAAGAYGLPQFFVVSH